MLAIGTAIRFRLATILAAHWSEFVASHGKWIRPVVFETVRKILACRTYRCPKCGDTEIVPDLISGAGHHSGSGRPEALCLSGALASLVPGAVGCFASDLRVQV